MIHRYKMTIFTIFILLIFLLSIGIQTIVFASDISNSNTNIFSKIKNQIEIPAGSDYYIKFNSEEKKLEEEIINPITKGLTDIEKNAVAKAPRWIQRKLVQQFQYLDNSIEYANFVLSSPLKFTDEIAFIIAHSPLGKVPEIDVIYDNVFYLYEIDKYVLYSDIIDYDFGDGNYYSTIRYWIIEDNTVKEFEYPRDIYYWYVVHPHITREDPIFVYNKFWREYLFYHNDVGHPLLKEQLQDIYLRWDGESYSPETELGAVSYWLDKTKEFFVIGDRSGQPNIIAHEHNGLCGESQKLTVAAHRTALTPCIGVLNSAEDHVWSEFYEREWYHLDGGYVNNPYVYTDGWGKDMSSIYAWNGDDTIYEVTSKYIHPEDRITVEFNVEDGFGNPLDGALITVFVKGLRDVSVFKYTILEVIENVWNKIPDLIKGKILENIYTKIQDRIEEVPDVIDSVLISIWNHTDTTGRCTFELGKNDEYIFLIQKPNINLPWPLTRYNRLKTLSDAQDITYDICFADFSNKIQSHKNFGDIQGNYMFNMKLNISSYQLQKNPLTQNIGTYNFPGKIDFFIVDEDNFEKYNAGRKFNTYYYQELQNEEVDFSLNDKDYYLIFRNHAHMTNAILDIDLSVETSDDIESLEIVTPSTNIFEACVYNIGDKIEIEGIATSNQIILYIDEEPITIETQNNEWQYPWDVADRSPGRYKIVAQSENLEDQIYIKLIDAIPPSVKINSPEDLTIVEAGIVIFSGVAIDNYKLDRVELSIDEGTPVILDGIESWLYTLDVTDLNLGEHLISVNAYDYSGLSKITNLIIVKNETGQNFHPTINSIFHTPENLTNKSNVVIYSNVTSENPFSIKNVVLYLDNGIGITKQEIFKYGDFPPQERHEEDTIQDIPNDPIYGIELGQFQKGETITYWIEAIDTANNKIRSFMNTFTIE